MIPVCSGNFIKRAFSLCGNLSPLTLTTRRKGRTYVKNHNCKMNYDEDKSIPNNCPILK
jgi:hypothetical protein